MRTRGDGEPPRASEATPARAARVREGGAFSMARTADRAPVEREDDPRTPDNEESGWGGKTAPARHRASPDRADHASSAPVGRTSTRASSPRRASHTKSRHEHETLSDRGTPSGLGGQITASCETHDNVSALHSDRAGASSPPGGTQRYHDRASSLHRSESVSAFPPRAPDGDDSPAAESARLVRVAEMLQIGGRASDALNVLERALALVPDHQETRIRVGLCHQALGAFNEAYANYASVLAVDPGHVHALRAVGFLYQTHGMLTEAAESYRGALVVEPNDTVTRRRLAAALTDLGTRVKLLGSPARAIVHYREASAVDEAYAPTMYNLGVVFSELGRHDDALECYGKATELDSAHADAHCNIGVLLKARGDLAGAIASYEACLRANPNHQLGRGNLSIALRDHATAIKNEGDVAGAIRTYERALTFDPNSAESMYNLGVAQAEIGEIDRAIISYETTLKLRPQCAEAWNNLGVLHREKNNVERAVECYVRAVSINPNFAQPLNNIGILYTMQGQARAALEALQRAVAADPTYAVAQNNLGVLLRDTGDIPEALEAYRACAALEPNNRNATQNYLLGLNYVQPGESEEVCAAHLAWGERFRETVGKPLPEREFDPETDPGAGAAVGSRRRLVVGYVSPDLYTHSVSYFASAPLTHHDPNRVRMIVYSATPREDAQTALLREAVANAGGEWKECSNDSERSLAETIRADGVDVLVELTGHTANNRLGALALRPAPVQVTWIGYPNTTGMREVDYRLTDAVADPPETTQTHAESLVRLPGCFLCYAPSADAPEVAPAPCLTAGFVTFGCFNTLAKVTPTVRRLWGRLLAAVPNSRLLVKAKPFACQTIQRRFLASMEAEGVESWRVDLSPLAGDTAHHLSMYGMVDIALDTFPYAGTTTTCEAMYMGVPVVTLRGGCHAHNVGASLARAADVTEPCVAANEDEYVAKCVRLASDATALATLREGMRARMTRGELCDGAGFTRGLEETFARLFRKWCEEKTRADGDGRSERSDCSTQEGDDTRNEDR